LTLEAMHPNRMVLFLFLMHRNENRLATSRMNYRPDSPGRSV
jgi:hypothetical protein